MKLINNSWRKRKRNHERDIHRSQYREWTVGPLSWSLCIRACRHRMLALSQPGNCIFWPIITLNWLFAASKLHKHIGIHKDTAWVSVLSIRYTVPRYRVLLIFTNCNFDFLVLYKMYFQNNFANKSIKLKSFTSHATFESVLYQI